MKIKLIMTCWIIISGKHQRGFNEKLMVIQPTPLKLGQSTSMSYLCYPKGQALNSSFRKNLLGNSASP